MRPANLKEQKDPHLPNRKTYSTLTRKPAGKSPSLVGNVVLP
jgi:hypothetical protein